MASVDDLWLVDFGEPYPGEPGSYRPALVLGPGFALELADEFGLRTHTPGDPARRGGQLAVRHPDARRLHGVLIERRIIVDHRDPDVPRLGLSPLTTRSTDVFEVMTVLAELIATAN